MVDQPVRRHAFSRSPRAMIFRASPSSFDPIPFARNEDDVNVPMCEWPLRVRTGRLPIDEVSNRDNVGVDLAGVCGKEVLERKPHERR
jgi:hypothetical protein